MNSIATELQSQWIKSQLVPKWATECSYWFIHSSSGFTRNLSTEDLMDVKTVANLLRENETKWNFDSEDATKSLRATRQKASLTHYSFKFQVWFSSKKCKLNKGHRIVIVRYSLWMRPGFFAAWHHLLSYINIKRHPAAPRRRGWEHLNFMLMSSDAMWATTLNSELCSSECQQKQLFTNLLHKRSWDHIQWR